MPKLYDEKSNALLGTITEADVQCLVDVLEEEDSQDADYFVDDATVDILEESGASEPLVKILRAAIGSSPGIDVRWEK